MDKELQKLGFTKPLLNKIQKRYYSCQSLVKGSENMYNPSVTDPEAIQALKDILSSIDDGVKKSKQSEPRIASLVATCKVLIINGNCTEEEEELEKDKVLNNRYAEDCKNILEKLESIPTMAISASFLHIQIGAYYYKIGKVEEAFTHFQKGSMTFQMYVTTKTKDMFNNFGLFTKEVDPEVALKKNTLMGFSWIAQIFFIMGEYIHSAWARNTMINLMLSLPDDHKIPWIPNIVSETVALANTFLNLQCFDQINYYLSICESLLIKYDSESQDKEKDKKIRISRAEIAHSAGQATLTVLEQSVERLKAQDLLLDSPYVDNGNLDAILRQMGPLRTKYQFKLGNLPSGTKMIEKVPLEYAEDFQDASKLYKKVLEYLEDSKSYFTWEHRPNFYPKVVLKIARAHEFIAFFKKNQDFKLEKHKLKIELLKDLLDKASETSVLANVWYELGQAYNQIVDIQGQAFAKENKKIEQANIDKINEARDAALKYYKLFVGCKKLDNIEDEFTYEMFQILNSHFLIGDLYNKSIETDPVKKLSNLKESLASYEFCEKYSKNMKALERVPDLLMISITISRVKTYIKTLEENAESYKPSGEMFSSFLKHVYSINNLPSYMSVTFLK